MLTIGSLCSGIGLLELGLEWAGLGPTVWQCEALPERRAVLRHHWPETTLYFGTAGSLCCDCWAEKEWDRVCRNLESALTEYVARGEQLNRREPAIERKLADRVAQDAKR